MSPANPFVADPDRGHIWEMLVPRDTEAFVAGDWSRVAADFHEEGFTGIRGAAHPDRWDVAFPTLASYREYWLEQSRAFAGLRFAGESGLDLLMRATRLEQIDIAGDRALAHKKFKAVGQLDTGEDYSIDWQSVYTLARIGNAWRITGFVGYLPHPFPSPGAAPAIEAVHESCQHVTAGPYSPVLKVRPGVIVAISGQGPIGPAGDIVGTGIVEQSRVTLENCLRQLAAAGAGPADVFQVRVYLSSMADWEAFNRVYREYMHPPFPVRTAIEARLWGGMLVEVDMLANVVPR